MASNPKSQRNASIERELAQLIKQAAARPGIAELMRLSREYQDRIEETARRTGRRHNIVMTTTDSTA